MSYDAETENDIIQLAKNDWSLTIRQNKFNTNDFWDFVIPHITLLDWCQRASWY